MAFRRKKSEDPWNMDPNRKREPALFYEREADPEAEPAENAVADAPEAEQPEAAPVCPWCGETMTRAYIVGGRDKPRLTDRKPTAFLGTLGYETLDFSDDGFWITHKSCWQCKPCRKVVAEIPELGPEPENSVCWDGNPVAPLSPEEIEP